MIALVRESHRREITRHRPGPRDPWLNEVTVALSDLEFTETERNTGSQLGVSGRRRHRPAGRHPEGVRQPVLRSTTGPPGRARTAGQARDPGRDRQRQDRDQAQRAGSCSSPKPPARSSTRPRRRGRSAGRTDRGAAAVAAPRGAARPRVSHRRIPMCLSSCVTLAELHRAGALTDAEFEAKKVELLGRV